ncbi:MAG: hypothetical protein ACREN7_00320 [Candidatus Dormibacteria bacterium]
MSRQPDHCRGCGAEIVWGRHALTGGRMPLDAHRTEKGVWLLSPSGTVTYSRAAGLAHESHFVTCPNAAMHRRPRGMSKPRPAGGTTPPAQTEG